MIENSVIESYSKYVLRGKILRQFMEIFVTVKHKALKGSYRMGWMNDNDTNKWSEGLPFVQFTKNTTYHKGIHQSPYEAMFDVKAKRGTASSLFPSEQIAIIETEEQLEEIVNTFEIEE
ncbi:uncharacterized protein TNCV_781331 [Trichonephila clavipes]|nr:uncharacterized protein TNCV_781331 [Trichonephila clavipes]